MIRSLTVVMAFAGCSIVSAAQAADADPEVKRFAGHWEVVELVENGKVIPREAIREWLPSGGRVEIADNAIMFAAPQEGKKSVKLFSLDATRDPKGIEIVTREKKDAWGIYRFSEQRLVICLADPEKSRRPDDFSAGEDSERMLMVLKRVSPKPAPSSRTAPEKSPAKAKPRPATVGTAKILNDAQATELLVGSWRHNDSAGALYVTLNAAGGFQTVREVQEIRLFQKAFVRTPVSTGNWSVQDGRLMFDVKRSAHWDRVDHRFVFSIRSISDRDFIFVDSLGRLGQAAKVQ